jgi:RNA polymerase sigma-70 factor (ECF subfamily)
VTTATTAEEAVVAALRRGEEDTIADLVESWSNAMLRLALAYVNDRAVAEEVVQDAWIGVLEGIDRFEGRASLKTWVFRILANRAKTRAVRERRTVPFSTLDSASGLAVEPDRFVPAGEAWAGHWASPPRPSTPEERLLASETRERLEQAIAKLPPGQRAVLTLRDVEGWSARETCNALDLTETNQRVLLHRARGRIRRVLEPYLQDEET